MKVEDIYDIRFKDLESDNDFTEIFIRKDDNYFIRKDYCTDENFCTECGKWYDKNLYEKCPSCETNIEDIVTEDQMIDVFDAYIDNMDNAAIYINGERIK